jgi:hypothetical protein
MEKDYRKETVSSAEKFSRRYGQEIANSVRNHVLRNQDGKSLRVVRVSPSGKADVYCLSVPENHCFTLSNGVVASNCGDESALLFMHRPLTQLPPKEVKITIPKNITEVAILEREQIWDEIRRNEEMEGLWTGW